MIYRILIQGCLNDKNLIFYNITIDERSCEQYINWTYLSCILRYCHCIIEKETAKSN
ncbi:hypothetical protein HanIR_Chr15g0768701 [Helianthus annuus]|nr:hypothetical protein HanIR_Chr15g0768701 [Helianthus annuus]